MNALIIHEHLSLFTIQRKTLSLPPDKFVTVKWAARSLLLCYGNAVLWSVGPHCGWGSYAAEHAEPNSFICSLDWQHGDPAYLVLAFLGSYLGPCAIMSGAYAAIWRRLAKTGKAHIRLKPKPFPANLNKVSRWQLKLKFKSKKILTNRRNSLFCQIVEYKTPFPESNTRRLVTDTY